MVVLAIRDAEGKLLGTLSCPTYDHLNDLVQDLGGLEGFKTQLIVPED